MPTQPNDFTQADQEILAIQPTETTAATEDASYCDYVLNRALTLWAANPSAKEFAPFVNDGKFSIKDYMRTTLDGAVAQDDSYRDATVSRALTSWFVYQTSPEFTPFISNGVFSLGDYMRAVGLVVTGTDRADLTEYNLVEPVDNVMINHADFTEAAFLPAPNKQVNNFTMTDVITENAQFSGNRGTSLLNCIFNGLQYNWMLWQDLPSTSCVFSNSVRFTPPTITMPTFIWSMYSDNEIVSPSNSVFYVRNSNFIECLFDNFPLSNSLAYLNNFANNTHMGNQAIGNVSLAEIVGELWEPVGSTDINNGVLHYNYVNGFITGDQYPDNMPCQNMSAALVLLDGARLRGADFTNSTLLLSWSQKLNHVDLTGAIFDNVTILYNSRAYNTPAAIQSLFTQLGMVGSIAMTAAKAVNGEETKVVEKKGQEPATVKLSSHPSRLLKGKQENDENSQSSHANNSKRDDNDSKDEAKRDPNAGGPKR